MLPVQLIRKKREGLALADDELRAFIAGVTDGSIPDYQVAAMLMAVFFRGMDDRELATWADAMTRSGDVIDLSHIARAKVDKAGFLAQSAMKLELENGGQKITSVGSVSRDMVLRSRIEILFSPRRGRRYALVLFS